MTHDHLGSGTRSRNVALAFAITVAFMLVEETVDFLAGSLVLVADALRTTLQQFDIEHITIQVENERLEGELEQPCFPGQSPCYADDASAVAAPRLQR
jgi:Co/Zn/Cd efflux system component